MAALCGGAHDGEPLGQELVESEVVDLAMDRAETLLKEKFGASDQQSAITAYVGEVSSAELGGSVR